ncbi:MAG: VOC family protein [Candidatus Micrarchaeota archaeon]
MNLKELTPNLMVEDVNKTIEFYKSLGFEVAMTVPDDGKLDWAIVKQESVSLMFQSRKSLTDEMPVLKDKEIGGSLTFYIDVDNVEELHKQFKAKATLVRDLHTKPYGMKEFAIQDCNGFVLVFAERI